MRKNPISEEIGEDVKQWVHNNDILNLKEGL